MNNLCFHMLPPEEQSFVERFQYKKASLSFDEDKHLTEKEKQYIDTALHREGIFIIRETEEGWWKESLDFKGDIEKQIMDLIKDPTVAYGWIIDQRFAGHGWGEW